MSNDRHRDSSESPPSHRELYREFRADGHHRLKAALFAVVIRDVLSSPDLDWNPPDRDKWRDERQA